MPLACPECGFELRPAYFESPEYRDCQICGGELSVLPFPACFTPPVLISNAELQRSEEEASCFHHESKKAVTACTRCGKFLCALCAVELGSDILCPECLAKPSKDTRLERERTLYDSIALTLAVAPAFTLSLTIIGAPAALFVALRFWKRPTSIVRRFTWRKYAAVILGLLELAFWVFLIIALVLAPKRGGR